MASDAYKNFKQAVYRLLVPFLRLAKYLHWRWYLATAKEINLVVGAGGTNFPGWFSTDIDTLNVTKEEDFARYFSAKKIDKILAEHVLEHLTAEEIALMAANCFKYSNPGIRVRVAVPDGNHADSAYRDAVKPGGVGCGAFDHKHLFTRDSLAAYFTNAGFTCVPVEYWDAQGVFHKGYANDAYGYISRSFINDSRNANGVPVYTSLILDFIK